MPVVASQAWRLHSRLEASLEASQLSSLPLIPASISAVQGLPAAIFDFLIDDATFDVFLELLYGLTGH